MTPPYPRTHVFINSASGPNRTIPNTLSDLFRKYGVDRDVSITKRCGMPAYALTLPKQTIRARESEYRLIIDSRKPLSIMSAEARFLHLPTLGAGMYCRRGRGNVLASG
jgi:hypothetical protein